MQSSSPSTIVCVLVVLMGLTVPEDARTFDAFVVHSLALSAKHGRDPAIALPTFLICEVDHSLNQMLPITMDVPIPVLSQA
jgi:hypothetical protein